MSPTEAETLVAEEATLFSALALDVFVIALGVGVAALLIERGYRFCRWFFGGIVEIPETELDRWYRTKHDSGVEE